ncbi:MAG: T9SS type A sorting domain-containing protein [Flavobacteriaceae bacterium]|nr:T9SS type A sorting domain-containing protein [Flavobacteriaceae bacterium]
MRSLAPQRLFYLIFSLLLLSGFNSTAQLEVYNLLGHRKDQRMLEHPKGEVALELSSYSSGTYIVVLKQHQKVIQQILLIKD